MRTMRTLVRTRPFEEMNQMIDQLFGDRYENQPGVENNILPVDVLEHDDRMVIRASVPGMNPENIDISIEDDVLTLKGETHAETEHRDAKVYRREIASGTFTRSIRLPNELDLDSAEAQFDHGLMTITIPRQEKPRRTIKVQVNNQAVGASETVSETETSESENA